MNFIIALLCIEGGAGADKDDLKSVDKIESIEETNKEEEEEEEDEA
jgi:hypothetical protein